MGRLALLFGYENIYMWQGETVARSDTLTQANLSRLGETCRNRPGLHSSSRSGEKLLFWVRHYLAHTKDARLSENAWKPWYVAPVLA